MRHIVSLLSAVFSVSACSGLLQQQTHSTRSDAVNYVTVAVAIEASNSDLGLATTESVKVAEENLHLVCESGDGIWKEVAGLKVAKSNTDLHCALVISALKRGSDVFDGAFSVLSYARDTFDGLGPQVVETFSAVDVVNDFMPDSQAIFMYPEFGEVLALTSIEQLPVINMATPDTIVAKFSASGLLSQLQEQVVTQTVEGSAIAVQLKGGKENILASALAPYNDPTGIFNPFLEFPPDEISTKAADFVLEVTDNVASVSLNILDLPFGPDDFADLESYTVAESNFTTKQDELVLYLQQGMFSVCVLADATNLPSSLSEAMHQIETCENSFNAITSFEISQDASLDLCGAGLKRYFVVYESTASGAVQEGTDIVILPYTFKLEGCF